MPGRGRVGDFARVHALRAKRSRRMIGKCGRAVGRELQVERTLTLMGHRPLGLFGVRVIVHHLRKKLICILEPAQPLQRDAAAIQCPGFVVRLVEQGIGFLKLSGSRFVVVLEIGDVLTLAQDCAF